MGVTFSPLDPSVQETYWTTRELFAELKSLADPQMVGRPDPRSDESWDYSQAECLNWASRLEGVALNELAGLLDPEPGRQLTPEQMLSFASFLRACGSGIRHDR